ncbi:junctional adhesion molecule C [Protopterus annectens]|uniref:junctional adhesion molecule C n=1 Tax=Protopterus annectens TaxID=7888 RepID=UPI001CFC05A4|nr:junctional adhesion molecule C [Protopterus annectens]
MGDLITDWLCYNSDIPSNFINLHGFSQVIQTTTGIDKSTKCPFSYQVNFLILFTEVELSCIIKSTATTNPRIEWKKLTSKDPIYVFYQENMKDPFSRRFTLLPPASLSIQNASRTDSGSYRCEVVAENDVKTLAEITINLTVQVKPVKPRCSVPKAVPVGKSAELHCSENEGHPQPNYYWYRDGDQLPEDSRSEQKFNKSSFTLNRSSGTLKFMAVNKGDTGKYHCVVRNAAGSSQCEAQIMDVYDINIAAVIVGVLVVILVLVLISAGICCAYKRGYFASKKSINSHRTKADDVDYIQGDNEGDFRHKSSFVI